MSRTCLHLCPELEYDLRAFRPGPGRKTPRLFKGGGSSSNDSAKQYYDTLGRIGQEQWDLYKEHGLNQTIDWANQSFNFDNLENQNKYADLAAADAQSAASSQRAQTERQATSMGMNPGDGSFKQVMADADLGNAALEAGAQNNARRYVKDMGYAKTKDALSMMQGMGSDATASMSSAANGYMNIGAAQRQQSAMDTSNMAMGAYGAYKMMFADGGSVNCGKTVRFASGGTVARKPPRKRRPLSFSAGGVAR